MTDRIKLTEEDLHVIHDEDGAGNGYEFNVKFLSLEGHDICWKKEQAEQLKAQILEDQEKAEMYDKFEKGLGWAREMIQDDKQLKEKLEKINKVLEDVRMTSIPSCIDEHTTRMHQDLKAQMIVVKKIEAILAEKI